MSGVPIHTWRELLLPNGQDTTIYLSKIDTTGECSTNPSAFIPHEWGPNRHPSGIRLVNGLPSMMHGHLDQILDNHFSSEAAGTQFTAFDATFTPRSELAQLRIRCKRKLEFNYENGVGVIAERVSDMVRQVYYALTGTSLEFDGQEPTKYGEVITGHVYRDHDEIKILWEDKAPAVFNKFIERLQEPAHEPVPRLWSESSSASSDDYEATGVLGKVRIVVSISGLYDLTHLHL
jgi:hypothetical protein